MREAQSWEMAPALMGFASTNMRDDLSASKEKVLWQERKIYQNSVTAGVTLAPPLPQSSCGIVLCSVLSTWRFASFGSFQFTASLSSHFTEWKTEV